MTDLTPSIAACLIFAGLSIAGCAPAPAAKDTQVTIAPPPTSAAPEITASAPAASASAAPASASAAPPAPPSAAPSVAPSAAASVDREHCRPKSPAVTFEVENDDHVVALDAQGCPLGGSSFKANGYSYKASVTFMTELQRRLKAGDKAGVADMMNYPLRVNFDKKPTHTVKSAADLLKEFDRLYSPSVTDAILKADPRDIFCNYQGIMLGSGVVWADNEHGSDYKVIVINTPK